jgi:hypothetical protein
MLADGGSVGLVMGRRNSEGAIPGRSALRLVGARLPQVREGLARLFERDEDFRHLCDRYAATLGGPGSEDFLLEGELLVYLAEHQER